MVPQFPPVFIGGGGGNGAALGHGPGQLLDLPGLTFSLAFAADALPVCHPCANAFKPAAQPIKNPHHYRGEGCLLVGRRHSTSLLNVLINNGIIICCF